MGTAPPARWPTLRSRASSRAARRRRANREATPLSPDDRILRASSVSRRSELGQFFTPEPVTQFIARALLADEALKHVLDLTVGGGVPLLTPSGVLRGYGSDIDNRSIELAGARLPEADCALAPIACFSASGRPTRADVAAEVEAIDQRIARPRS